MATKRLNTTFRDMTGRAKARAHSMEDKGMVRQLFIDVGQRLINDEGVENVSLRRIAAEAGYSPGTIYKYFRDHRDLLFAVREFDMDAATDRIENEAAGEKDPTQRLRKLFMASVQNWLAHMDQFALLFAGPMYGRKPDGPLFAQSASVARSLALYRGAVDAFLESLPRRPLPTILATDVMIATSHGIIAFPHLTSTLQWSDVSRMAEEAIDALIVAWSVAGGKHARKKTG